MKMTFIHKWPRLLVLYLVLMSPLIPMATCRGQEDSKDKVVQPTFKVVEDKINNAVIITIPDSELGEAPAKLPKVGWLNSCGNFLDSRPVKSAVDLLYDAGTATGIYLWGRSDPYISNIGVIICLTSHAAFLVAPRSISNLNQLINRPESFQARQARNLKHGLRQFLEKIKVLNGDGENMQIKVCNAQKDSNV